MIILTKLNGKEILINERHIETAKESPDTVISMSSGATYIVSEKLDEIMDKVIEFNRNSKRKSRFSGGEAKQESES
ncbi:MAG: flagellar FlbD family protein [Oscillospiraceae bacterium]|nr:flagellar FlbD family protein [Oscillospiraceae bacterium]